MNQWNSLFESSHMLRPVQILLAFLLAFTLSFVFAMTYRWTHGRSSYSRPFVHTMVLGAMIVCMVMMGIGSNLARGLGILGTLAIIRFRTPIRNSLDMMFLFASFGVGICCGVAVFHIAIMGTIVICAAAMILHWSPFTTRCEYGGLLRFTLPSAPTREADLQKILRQYCSAFHIIAMREAAQGELLEYSYQVRLTAPSSQAKLIESLKEIDEVGEPSLLMQRTTVEL